MEALKATLAAKKAETRGVLGGAKSIKRSDLEAARLKRLRDEEEAERAAKEQKKGQGAVSGANSTGAAPGVAATASTSPDKKQQQQQQQQNEADSRTAPSLSKAEVVRRLRALGQPATLFGEDDGARMLRLLRVEKEVVVVDETRGGGENSLLELRRQEKLAKQKGMMGGSGKETAGAAGGKAAPGGSKSKEGGAAAAGPQAPKPAAAAGADGAQAAAAQELDPTLAAFQRAAAELAEKRAEEALEIEDRINKYLRHWCEDWQLDLEARPEEVKGTGQGHQDTMVYQQSMKYLEPLMERLKRRQLEPELKVGLWMMIQHMRERNYLAANDVYLRLAIGNSPWPIGVTSVGIHERSAREKISHVMNQSGQAHIMNDEATRKYFQGIKRLMTVLQRLYPTDPSRAVDFNLTAPERQGQSDKAALLAAEAAGQRLALTAAPHHVANDGSIRIPEKWNVILQREIKAVEGGSGSGGGGAMPPPRTPPRGTPPQQDGSPQKA